MPLPVPSLDADQATSTLPQSTTLAETPAGTVGGVVSTFEGVVATAVVEYDENVYLPRRTRKARTR